MTTALESADRHSDWTRWRVVVAGIGRTGFSVADALLELGAQVCVVDDSPEPVEQATLLEMLGADVRLGTRQADTVGDDCDLVVASPGWLPTDPLLKEASRRSIPVWPKALTGGGDKNKP